MPEQPPSPGANAISSEAVAEAQKQTESSFIQLMNRMEASIPTNGDFFIKLGQREDGSRVLILREGRKRTETDSDYIAITRFGPKKVILSTSDFSTDSAGLKKINGELNIYTRDRAENLELSVAVPKLSLSRAVALHPITSDEDKKFVKEAMSNSIKVAKETSQTVKNKAALEAEQRDQAIAKELLDLFPASIQAPQASTNTSPAA
ncbi:MAG: hypothetical protein Q7R31_03845 [Candidatus Levybacteria bacterium]|nr:hypothetical protein [Candidatus Levybacteria bacterium]